MADATEFKIVITGPGVEIEKEISNDLATRLITGLLSGNIMKTLEPSNGATSDEILESGNAQPKGRPKMSVREYLDETNAKRNPDKLTAIGSYLTELEQRPDFSKDDVKARLRQAGEPISKNFSRDWAWAVKNGWIAEDPHKKGALYVTNKGTRAVKEKFSLAVRKASALPSSRRRSGSKAIVTVLNPTPNNEAEN